MSSNDSTKRCGTCGEEKPLDNFYRASASKDGRRDRCKMCAAEYQRAYREKNREATRERNRKWYENNREKCAEINNRWRAENPDQVRDNNRRYRAENRDRINEYHRQWSAENRERINEWGAEYREKNRAACNARAEAWRLRNPERHSAMAAKRRAVKLKATPPWVQLSDLQPIYDAAAALREAGEDVHVDHIVPLAGKTVCGLHVPWNLQIIPARENLSKGNRLTT